MTRVIAVINQKGGVGKTTSSIQIGSLLRYLGYKVLMIDMDPQCSLSHASNANMDTYSILDVMIGNATARNIIQKLPAYDLIPSNGNLASYPYRFKGEKKEYRFKSVIEPVKELYDYIIVDSPPTLGDITVGILTASDSYIVPAICDLFSVEGVKQICDTTGVIRTYTNPNLECDGVLVTRYHYKFDKNYLPVMIENAEELQIPVIPRLVRESAIIKQSLEKRRSLTDFNPQEETTSDYIMVVKYLLKKWNGVENGK